MKKIIMLSICLPAINSIFPYQVDYPSQSFSSSLKYESDTNSQNDRTLIEGIEKHFIRSLIMSKNFLRAFLIAMMNLLRMKRLLIVSFPYALINVNG